jgi:hypothetical protein
MYAVMGTWQMDQSLRERQLSVLHDQLVKDIRTDIYGSVRLRVKLLPRERRGSVRLRRAEARRGTAPRGSHRR